MRAVKWFRQEIYSNFQSIPTVGSFLSNSSNSRNFEDLPENLWPFIFGSVGPFSVWGFSKGFFWDFLLLCAFCRIISNNLRIFWNKFPNFGYTLEPLKGSKGFPKEFLSLTFAKF